MSVGVSDVNGDSLNGINEIFAYLSNLLSIFFGECLEDELLMEDTLIRR
jgi:hypothetical protein